MKKITIPFLLLIGFFVFSLSAAEINLDDALKNNNIPTYIREGVRFIPLDDLARILKARLNFGLSEEKAFLFYDRHKISLIAGSSDILVDGNLEKMEPPPQFMEGIFVVPLARIKEILAAFEVSVQEEEETEQLPSIKEAIGLSSGTSSQTSLPSIETALTASTESSGKKIIVLDPGHGGRDPGAIGQEGLREKDVTLDIGLRLNNLLEKREDLVVLMTRKTDTDLAPTTEASLLTRVEFANRKKANLFLSIHANSSPRWDSWKADGFETYCPRSKSIANNADDSEVTNDADLGVIVGDLNQGNVLEESERFASLVQEELAKRLLCPDRGVKKKNLYVLKYTRMPSALVEVGFICNPNIEANLRDPKVRQAIAETLYKAIIRYFEEE